MSDKKDEMMNLILKGNVSAIQILSDRLEITPDEVRIIIEELLEEGRLKGSLTEDGKRFFKSEVKLSDAPSIDREDNLPDFMNFNARPAITVTIVGFLIIAAGLIYNSMATDIVRQNIATVLIFIGLCVTMGGMYWFSQRKTPS
ncbi:MAG: hypothetical protein ACFFEK_14460 [Candidatus Thorarchaeota archaeon]